MSTRSGFYLVNFGGTVITASLAIKVEDISLLYVAHDTVIDVVSTENTAIFVIVYNMYFYRSMR